MCTGLDQSCVCPSLTFQVRANRSKAFHHHFLSVSAVGLISRAEALAAAAATHSEGSSGPRAQPLSQQDLDGIHSLLLQNQKVLTKLQEVLRKDDRDVAIMSQPSSDLLMMTT